MSSPATESAMAPLLLATGEASPVLIDPLSESVCEGTLEALVRTLRKEIDQRCPWAGVVDVPGKGPVEIGLVLSRRAENVLRRHGIATMGRLLAMSRREVLDLSGAGIQVCDEIEERLAELGLSLRAEEIGHGR